MDKMSKYVSTKFLSGLFFLGAPLAVAFFLSGPAWAAEWHFYGIANIRSFIHNRDTPEAGGLQTYSHVDSDSKIGARIRANDQLKARFELDTEGTLKKLYGEWKFGAGRVLIGQTYTPVYMDYCLEEYGGISGGRRPMIQLRIKGLKLALIAPRAKSLNISGTTRKVVVPKFEVSYNWDSEDLAFELAAGYNTYELIKGSDTYRIDSYLMGLGAQAQWGAVLFAGNIYLGRNLGPYGLKTATDAFPTITGSRLNDNAGLGCVLMARYLPTDTVSMEVGYGYQASQLENAVSKDSAQACYGLVKFALAPGVYMGPEIGIIDEKKDANGNRESRTLYYGIEWEIQF